MQSVNGLYVYSYHHDDDQHGWIDVEAFRYPNQSSGKDEEELSLEFILKLRRTLSACGWEGDGVLSAMMVPPFFSSEGDTFWFPVFHVKQSNNGTSWIASERPLNTENLEPASPQAKS